jgi:hypothetical protein
VTIEEPTVESTTSILHGLKPRYEVRLYACARQLQAHVPCIQSTLIQGIPPLDTARGMPYGGVCPVGVTLKIYHEKSQKKKRRKIVREMGCIVRVSIIVA